MLQLTAAADCHSLLGGGSGAGVGKGVGETRRFGGWSTGVSARALPSCTGQLQESAVSVFVQAYVGRVWYGGNSYIARLSHIRKRKAKRREAGVWCRPDLEFVNNMIDKTAIARLEQVRSRAVAQSNVSLGSKSSAKKTGSRPPACPCDAPDVLWRALDLGTCSGHGRPCGGAFL